MWKEENNKLVRNFTFSTFVEAIEFLNKVAVIAEEIKHHPEIYNVYSKVVLSLTTHDKNNKVTEKDHQLAESIDKIV